MKIPGPAKNLIENTTGADIDGDGKTGSSGGASTGGAGYSPANPDYEKYLKKHKGNYNYYEQLKPELSLVDAQYEDLAAQLDAAIADCEDPRQRTELKAARRDLQQVHTKLKNGPGGHRDRGEFTGMWQNRLENMDEVLGNVEILLHDVQSNDQLILSTAEMEPPTATVLYEDSGEVSSSNNVSGSGSAEGAESSADGAKGMADVDIDEMVHKMSTDPQAVMEELSDMPAEERGAVLQAITTQLQQVNQMFSAMSNIMKSAHDTAKAAINNMRV